MATPDLYTGPERRRWPLVGQAGAGTARVDVAASAVTQGHQSLVLVI